MLALNGHSSYQTAEFEYFCKENVIICLCMPPYTSYLLQLYIPISLSIKGLILSTFQTPQNPYQLDHKLRKMQRSL